MKLNRILGCVLGLVAFTAASGAPLTESERVRAEIMPSFNAMQAAANVHDADAHLAFIARDPDLIFVAGDRRIIGWDALLEQQRKWWPRGRMKPTGADVPYKVTEGPDFIVIDPTCALVSFMLDAPKTGPEGTRVDRTLAVSQLWQKRPEGWRVTYVHESATVMPPGK